MVQSDLFLLRKDESPQEIESPVKILIEHPQGLLAVAINSFDEEFSGLAVSGLDLFLDKIVHFAFIVELILVHSDGETVGLNLLNLSSGLVQNFFLFWGLPTTASDNSHRVGNDLGNRGLGGHDCFGGGYHFVDNWCGGLDNVVGGCGLGDSIDSVLDGGGCLFDNVGSAGLDFFDS